MTNKEVIKNFVRGKEGKTSLRKIPEGDYYYKGRTLRAVKINSNVATLWNYKTLLALYFKAENTIIMNGCKYSPTTSIIQKQLRQTIPSYIHFEEFDGSNEMDLIRFINTYEEEFYREEMEV